MASRWACDRARRFLGGGGERSCRVAACGGKSVSVELCRLAERVSALPRPQRRHQRRRDVRAIVLRRHQSVRPTAGWRVTAGVVRARQSRALPYCGRRRWALVRPCFRQAKHVGEPWQVASAAADSTCPTATGSKHVGQVEAARRPKPAGDRVVAVHPVTRRAPLQTGGTRRPARPPSEPQVPARSEEALLKSSGTARPRRCGWNGRRTHSMWASLERPEDA